MKLSKRDCDNLIDALMEYDEQLCPKELADDEVGLMPRDSTTYSND